MHVYFFFYFIVHYTTILSNEERSFSYYPVLYVYKTVFSYRQLFHRAKSFGTDLYESVKVTLLVFD